MDSRYRKDELSERCAAFVRALGLQPEEAFHSLRSTPDTPEVTIRVRDQFAVARETCLQYVLKVGGSLAQDEVQFKPYEVTLANFTLVTGHSILALLAPVGTFVVLRAFTKRM